MSAQPDAESIESNFNKFKHMLSLLSDENNRNNALKLVDHLGERLALCPASSKKNHHSAHPGGLIQHSLNVLANAITYAKAFGWFKKDVTADSLIISSLFHDIGKVGDLNNDYYTEIDVSDWRAKRGEYYEYNSKLQFMTVPNRSIWLLSQFDVKLTYDEYISIMIHDGWFLDENKSYMLKEPLLSHILMTADYLSARQEKGDFP